VLLTGGVFGHTLTPLARPQPTGKECQRARIKNGRASGLAVRSQGGWFQVGFRINTNIQALNALRNLGRVESDFGKSVTRLSTGLRITDASDDPAGLIISENLRAQISGIDQAVRNAQDATSFAKTAEGALDEVNRLLRDARALAVASGNTAVLDTTSLQANQNQIQSIIDSVNRIAGQTQFGGKKLLDGSSGLSANVTDTAKLAGITLSGTFAGYAVSSNGTVSAAIIQSATKATTTLSVNYTSLSSVLSAATFVLNGVSISTDGTETLQAVINRVNQKSGQTGVTADAITANGSTVVQLNQVNYGNNFSISFSDTKDVLNATDSVTATAANAAVSVTVYTANGAQTVAFTGGRSSGESGLRLTDTYGNVLLLTEGGNNTLTTTAAAVANVTAGSATFQIGGNAGQTTSLSLANIAAAQLGTTAVANLNMSSIDVTTSSGAANAIQVIDAAISQISKTRADIGSFQRNNIESSVRSLGVAKENLTATESQIRDLDVASEITNFTKLQILQQSGLSVLAQANASPQSVLQLLR